MCEVVLTEEQRRLVASAHGPIRLKSAAGELLGVVRRGFVIRTPQDEERFLEQMRHRRGEPSEGRTMNDVLQRLKTLEAEPCPDTP